MLLAIVIREEGLLQAKDAEITGLHCESSLVSIKLSQQGRSVL